MTYGMESDMRTNFGMLGESLCDLGFVNEANRYAHASLDAKGYSSEILQLLVKTNILKGQTEAARTFLGLLCRNILYREWAEDCLQRMDADPQLGEDPELKAIRARMVPVDYVLPGKGNKQSISLRLAKAMEQQMAAGHRDKKLFEYLMGHLLLTRQLDKAILCLACQQHLDYPEMPRTYEEAILIYSAKHPESKLQLEGVDISEDAKARFRRFYFDSSPDSEGRPRLTRAAMARHSRSYSLYYVLGFSDARWADLQVVPAGTTGATK